MKFLIALMVFFISLPSMADDAATTIQIYKALEAAGEVTSLRCHFTEPFVEVSVALRSHGEERSKSQILFIPMVDVEYAKSIQVSIDKSTNAQGEDVLSFYQIDKQEIILRATKNNQGSDGMSDIIYTYDAVYSEKDFVLYGGCEIERYKATDLVPEMPLRYKILDWIGVY